MKNNHLISVIIPVYNVEKYLEACLESVENQSYKNIEVILVNDYSSDNSAAIADQFAKKDSRMKVVHKKVNEGLNYARRDGFKKSKGEYVTFLDSDDILHKDAIKILSEVLIESGSDAAVAGSKEFSDNDKDISTLVGRRDDLKEIRVLDSKNKILKYVILGEPCFPDTTYMTAWGKMFKRELVEGVNWHESNFRSYEDNFWTPQVISSANKLVLISNQLHFYRRNIKYGSEGGTLGNRLTGNSINGKPVGYIEYVDLLWEFNKKLSQKYDVNINTDLQGLRDRQSWSRLNVLVMAGLLDKENNLDYAKDVLVNHQKNDWQLQQQNAELDQRLHESDTEVNRLKAELDRFYTIKPTALRLLGNVKRRAIGIITKYQKNS